jgi:hypothetical protein
MSIERPVSSHGDDPESSEKDQPQPAAGRRFSITYKLPDGSREVVVESYASLSEAIFQAEQKRLWHSIIESVEEV